MAKTLTLHSKNRITYPLPAGRRLRNELAECVRNDISVWYLDGASIRDIVEHTGRSYGFVHRQLEASGVARRPRGGARLR